MKVIFEEEHPIGICECVPEGFPGKARRLTRWVVWIHTHGSLGPAGRGDMLRLEHRCFLRNGFDVAHQSWLAASLELQAAPKRAEPLWREWMLEQHEAYRAAAVRQVPLLGGLPTVVEIQ